MSNVEGNQELTGKLPVSSSFPLDEHSMSSCQSVLIEKPYCMTRIFPDSYENGVPRVTRASKWLLKILSCRPPKLRQRFKSMCETSNGRCTIPFSRQRGVESTVPSKQGITDLSVITPQLSQFGSCFCPNTKMC